MTPVCQGEPNDAFRKIGGPEKVPQYATREPLPAFEDPGRKILFYVPGRSRGERPSAAGFGKRGKNSLPPKSKTKTKALKKRCNGDQIAAFRLTSSAVFSSGEIHDNAMIFGLIYAACEKQHLVGAVVLVK